MARYVTTVESSLPAGEAFDLVANFASITDWDPGISHAERLDEGPLRVGSAFRLTSVFGPRRIPLTYVVRELIPGERIVLDAVTADFTSHDIITVGETAEGSRLTYDATLTLHGYRRVADPLLGLAFQVIGRRADAGLRDVLNPVPVAA
jgi:hypothetical protein